jgi:hypothetical protein
MQSLIAQMIGLIVPTDPLVVVGTLTQGSDQVTNVTPGGYYKDCSISGESIPLGSGILQVTGTTITMTAPATADGQVTITITDPNVYAKVRVAWQQKGQPGFSFKEDICTIRCTEVEQDYNSIRNVVPTYNGDGTVTQAYEYQRTWEIYLSFYGPNGFDNARVIKSAMFLDWAAGILSASNLYVIPDFYRTIRAPELVDEQWAERSDWKFLVNEGIVETTTISQGASVEIQTYLGTNGENQLIADITETNS